MMKFKAIIVLFFPIILSSCLDSQVNSMKLDKAKSLLNERPDSSLAIIRSIDTLSLGSKATKAKYSLLHAIALDKNYIDTTDINVVLPAVNYYIRRGSAEERFKSYYYLGRIQYNAGNFNDAVISYSKAEDMNPLCSSIAF